jgi:transposase
MKTIKQVIGIDVSKDTFHVCFGSIDSSQSIKILMQSSFTNNEKGFKALLLWKQKALNPDIPLYYVMEATGVYYENLAYFLTEQAAHVSVLLPNKSKSFARSLDIKTKTDKVDAAMLCRIGLERVLPAWKIPSVVMKQIKSLCREYKSLKTSGAKIKVRLHAYKYSYRPEKTTMARLKQQLLLLEKQMVMVEKEIRSCISQDEPLQKRVENIQQVKGLSLVTIITVIAETNGFAAITNAKQPTSYSGLDITMNQSGQFYGRTRISKKGNSHIRSALYLPAMSAVRYNIRLKQFYENIMLKHKCGKVGIVAVARKMLILIYTLWKKDTTYDPMVNVQKIS